MNIATNLLLDGCRGDCDTAVVISNDSDINEPITLAQIILGREVGAVNTLRMA